MIFIELLKSNFFGVVVEGIHMAANQQYRAYDF